MDSTSNFKEMYFMKFTDDNRTNIKSNGDKFLDEHLNIENQDQYNEKHRFDKNFMDDFKLESNNITSQNLISNSNEIIINLSNFNWNTYSREIIENTIAQDANYMKPIPQPTTASSNSATHGITLDIARKRANIEGNVELNNKLNTFLNNLNSYFGFGYGYDKDKEYNSPSNRCIYSIFNYLNAGPGSINALVARTPKLTNKEIIDFYKRKIVARA